MLRPVPISIPQRSLAQASAQVARRRPPLALARATDRFAGLSVLVMPGLHGSEPRHWQSAWERQHPSFRRVEQADWAKPVLDDWARRLVDAAIAAPQPVVVVAHSFGCLATVRAAAYQSGLIAGALLVAPADPERWGVAEQLPRSLLPFPNLLVASTDDPYLNEARATEWAERWGSEQVTLRGAGHINVKSGFEEWPLGLELLESLCRRLKPLARMPREASRRGKRRISPLTVSLE